MIAKRPPRHLLYNLDRKNAKPTPQWKAVEVRKKCTKKNQHFNYTYFFTSKCFKYLFINISSAELGDPDDNTILFCSESLCYSAIEKFNEVHECNQ